MHCSQYQRPRAKQIPDHILAEVRLLADQGCKEITFLGQTVNSYYYKHGDGRTTTLAGLFNLIHDTPGIERIKFVTNYPKDMDDELLDAVRELPKVCKYLHVPVQSGCNEVLKRMKRLYTVEYYIEMLQRCREKVPGVAVSSDFIVGFCGETEESLGAVATSLKRACLKTATSLNTAPGRVLKLTTFTLMILAMPLKTQKQ